MIVSYFQESLCGGSVHRDQSVGDVVESPGTGEVQPNQMDQFTVSQVYNLHTMSGLDWEGGGREGSLYLPRLQVKLWVQKLG